MSDELTVKNSRLRLIKGDITDLEIDAFVYYAQHDLALGSGFGTAISQRGGTKVQEELNSLAPLKTTEVVITDAGEMKANHIIHAVGPRFQEENLELISFLPQGAQDIGIACKKLLFSYIHDKGQLRYLRRLPHPDLQESR